MEQYLSKGSSIVSLKGNRGREKRSPAIKRERPSLNLVVPLQGEDRGVVAKSADDSRQEARLPKFEAGASIFCSAIPTEILY